MKTWKLPTNIIINEIMWQDLQLFICSANTFGMATTKLY